MSELGNNGKNEIERALAALAGEQRVRLLGPFPIAYNTPGINNPQVGQGYEVEGLIIPAGVMFTAFWMQESQWDVPGTATIVCGVSPSGEDGMSVKNYSIAPGTPPAAATSEPALAATGNPRWVLSIQEMSLFAAFWPDAADPSTGSANIYAFIAEPV